MKMMEENSSRQRTHPAILANMPLPLGEASQEEPQFSSNGCYLTQLAAGQTKNYSSHLDYNCRKQQQQQANNEKQPQALESSLELEGPCIGLDNTTTLPVCSHSLDSRHHHHDHEQAEIRELERELERILHQHLGEHDKINLSFYLNEFETGACNLADLLGFLIGRLLISLPNPVIRYRLLACIRRLYVEPRLATAATPPYGAPSSVGAAGQLDMRLFEATCRRYLAASGSLLSEAGFRELERDELSRRGRLSQRARAGRAGLSQPVAQVVPHPNDDGHQDGQLDARNSRANTLLEQEELMAALSHAASQRHWRRASQEGDEESTHSPKSSSTGQQLLKPALPVASHQLRSSMAELHGESDPAPPLGQPLVVPGSNANNPQGVYFPEPATQAHHNHWPLARAHCDPRRQSTFSQESPQPLASHSPALAASELLEWGQCTSLHHGQPPPPQAAAAAAQEEPPEEDSSAPWWRPGGEASSYIAPRGGGGGGAHEWGHLPGYGPSYGAFPGDNESQLAQLLPPTSSPSGPQSVRLVHDNGISSNSLNTHPPQPTKLTQHLIHRQPARGSPRRNTLKPPALELEATGDYQRQHLTGQPEPAFAPASITARSLTNNNNNYYYYSDFHYNNNAAWPWDNQPAGSEEAHWTGGCCCCCDELPMAAVDCRLCQVNQVDSCGAQRQQQQQQLQQDTVQPERQLKAISINEIYPRAPQSQSCWPAHDPPSWAPQPGTPQSVAAGLVGDVAGGGGHHFYCGEPSVGPETEMLAAYSGCQQDGPHSYHSSGGARIRAPTSSKPQPPAPPSSITGSDKLVALSGAHRSHRADHRHHHSHRRHHQRNSSSHRAAVDQQHWMGSAGIQQKDYWLRATADHQGLELEPELELELEENDDPAVEVLLVPAQARDKLPMSVAEQMKRQADSFVNQYNRAGAAKPDRRHKPTLQVRRTLKVRIKKSKPILGIAIEGGFNVSGQLLPRIVCVHEQGSAYQCGKLRASDLILEVNGKSTVNMTHDEIARTIAAAYYQNDCPYIEFLIGESVQTG